MESPEGTDPTRKGFSILLIEDNLADVGLVREALEAHNVCGELLVIGDGEHACHYVGCLDAQSADPPDLVIVDLNLPKRPGREVLAATRQSVKCRTAAVIVLSSSDAGQDQTESMALGASRYIRKPLRLRDFLALGAEFKALLEGSRQSF